MRIFNKYFSLLLILLCGVIFLFPQKSEAAGTIVPEVKIFEDNLQTDSFYGFLSSFRGGVRVATGDVDGDGVEEIIVGAGPGGGPHVQIFKADGTKVNSFMAYDIRFRNGIKIASGDVDGDGRAEIITSPESGGGPHVRVFDYTGQVKSEFMAYSELFRGGVNIACADIAGDSRAEIITGPGRGSGPHVRVFDNRGLTLNLDFWPFEFNHRGGVSVAGGNVHGDAKAEIIVAVFSGGKPIVEVYNNLKEKIAGFYAYDGRFLGGVNIAAGDIDNDGQAEIITAAGSGGGPHIRSFRYNGEIAGTNFFPYPQDFRGGVFVAAGNIKGDGKTEIITGPGFMAETQFANFNRYVEINISEQRLKLWDNGLMVENFIISSGKPGMDTPTGIYQVMNKSPNAYSSRYALYMPYWQQFTGLGHGLHGLPYWKLRSGGIIKEGENHLGIRVSHGCVRLSWEAAEIVYNFTSPGTPIVIH